MDPLSVAASVAGLMQAGAKVIGLLSTAVDAPSTARNVLVEVEALHGIFHQLSDFIAHIDEHSDAQTSSTYVPHLVITLTGCVCTFSELDAELASLNTDGGDGPKSELGAWDRVKWASKEQDIAKILRNLQMHKSSLNLFLSVYTRWPPTLEAACLPKCSLIPDQRVRTGDPKGHGRTEAALGESIAGERRPR